MLTTVVLDRTYLIKPTPINNNKILNIKYGMLFSRFMSGDTSYSEPSVWYLPYYGWPNLKDIAVNSQFARGVPPCYSGWESTVLYILCEVLINS